LSKFTNTLKPLFRNLCSPAFQNHAGNGAAKEHEQQFENCI